MLRTTTRMPWAAHFGNEISPTGGTANAKTVPADTFRTFVPGSNTNYHYTWMDYIYPYVKSVEVFKCPSAISASTNPSYGYNAAFSIRGVLSLYGVPANTTTVLADIKRPSDVYMVMDYNEQSAPTAYPGNAMKWAALAVTPSPASTKAQQLSVTPHMLGAVIGFADGHAKWIPRGQYAGLGTVTDYSSTCNLSNPKATFAYCSPPGTRSCANRKKRNDCFTPVV